MIVYDGRREDTRMDKFEKVERLRANANVSYEEAAAALDACGGDLLDAMILLEKQGKAAKPDQSVYSTSYSEQTEYIDVPDQVEKQKKEAPSLGKVVHTVIRFVKDTTFTISHKGEAMFRMPTWIMAILLLMFWKVLLPVGVIVLFFGIRYSFDGSENADAANQVLGKAGDIAEDMKKEFHKE